MRCLFRSYLLGAVASEPRASVFRVQLTAGAGGLVGIMAGRWSGVYRWGIHFPVGIFFARKITCC